MGLSPEEVLLPLLSRTMLLLRNTMLPTESRGRRRQMSGRDEKWTFYRKVHGWGQERRRRRKCRMIAFIEAPSFEDKQLLCSVLKFSLDARLVSLSLSLALKGTNWTKDRVVSNFRSEGAQQVSKMQELPDTKSICDMATDSQFPPIINLSAFYLVGQVVRRRRRRKGQTMNGGVVLCVMYSVHLHQLRPSASQAAAAFAPFFQRCGETTVPTEETEWFAAVTPISREDGWMVSPPSLSPLLIGRASKS